MSAFGVRIQTILGSKISSTHGTFKGLFSPVQPLMNCQCIFTTQFLGAEAALELRIGMDSFMPPQMPFIGFPDTTYLALVPFVSRVIYNIVIL